MSRDMRMTSVSAETARMEFAQEAAKDFAVNRLHWTHGELTPGSLLGIRWGLGEDCVLVVRLDDEEPVNFQNIIRGVQTRRDREAALEQERADLVSALEYIRDLGRDGASNKYARAQAKAERVLETLAKVRP